jgi:hypothetical protein
VSDVVTFVLEYAIAMRLPVWISVSVFGATEAALILMVLHPIAAIKAWQMGS